MRRTTIKNIFSVPFQTCIVNNQFSIKFKQYPDKRFYSMAIEEMNKIPKNKFFLSAPEESVDKIPNKDQVKPMKRVNSFKSGNISKGETF